MVFVKRFFALLMSAIITGAIASIMSTYRVIQNLRNIGTPISDGTAASTALYDLQHFAPLLTGFILLAFLVAFLLSGAVFKSVNFGRPIIYTAAGATAIFVMLYLMQKVFFGVPIVAGARDNLGLALQVLAGGLGGFIFALMTRLNTNIKKGPSVKDRPQNETAAAA